MLSFVTQFTGRVYGKICHHSMRSVSAVRVRFAPSPTGYMHIGGLRTALINKLFAKKYEGTFILRIEDTDQTRFHADAMKDIRDSLHWASLDADEGPFIGGQFGPYIQSERKAIYTDVTKGLIENNMAYRCFCSMDRLELLRNEQRRRGETPCYDNRCRHLTGAEQEERLQANQPFAVRFKVPSTKTVIHDKVFGEVAFETQDSEGDFIILKSDGMPVYHLANVVDDHLMQISHVIRGVEWLSSTPKHILLYNALNWTPPQFVHLPLLLSSSGGKLSKRSPEFAEIGQVRSLIAAGHLPSSVLTWLASVGAGLVGDGDGHDKWSPELQFQDLVSKFSLAHMSRQNVSISADILRICGRVHFDRMVAEAREQCGRMNQRPDPNSSEFLSRVRSYFDTNFPHSDTAPISVPTSDYELVELLSALNGRISRLSDLVDATHGFAFMWSSLEASHCAEHIKQCATTAGVSIIQLVQFLSHVLSGLTNTSGVESFNSRIKEACELYGIRRSVCMRILRLGICGREVGPPVVELIHLLGNERVLQRLDNVLQAISSHPSVSQSM